MTDWERSTTARIPTERALMLFSGRGNPDLSIKIGAKLGLELGRVQLETFADGEIYVKYEQSIRGADVFIVQPTCQPVNENLMELLIMIQAAKLASAKRITAVMPWYGYSRQDKKSQPREPITGRLVADLLVLARADAGQSLRMTLVELDRVLLDVFKQARVMARDRKISIVEMDQLQVEGDQDRLKQLLLILVDNAFRYTPTGGEIRLSLRSEPGAATVIVSDNGIGIEAEDLPHIFERFYRADRARAREGGGTGLGLSIAKWIAENHGGSLSVESQVGRGSTFTLRLPLVQVQPKL